MLHTMDGYGNGDGRGNGDEYNLDEAELLIRLAARQSVKPTGD